MMMTLLMLMIATKAPQVPVDFLKQGDLPKAVSIYRDRVDEQPWDRDRQLDLLTIRELVNAPREYAPPGLTGWRYRLSPLDLVLAATVCAVMVTVSGTIWLRHRTHRSLIVFGAGVFGWVVIGLLTVSIQSPDELISIVTQPTQIRTGNSESYPVVNPTPVPRGAEVVVHHVRGEWSRVTVGMVTGWMPNLALQN